MTIKIRPIPDIAIKFIRDWEGCVLSIYKDAAGLDTIGIGHLIRRGEDFSGGITEDQATELLRVDLLSAAASVCSLTKVPLSDNQYSALLSFVFNLGGGSYQASTLRSMLNRGEYRGAADQFDRWVYCRGQKLRGLVLRRAAEKKLFLSYFFS